MSTSRVPVFSEKYVESLVPISKVSTQIVAPGGSVSKKMLPPVLSGIFAVAVVVTVVVVVVVGEAADVIPVWISRSRNTRQTKNRNRFMPVLPERLREGRIMVPESAIFFITRDERLLAGGLSPATRSTFFKK
jgi:uncharacterized membrane protein